MLTIYRYFVAPLMVFVLPILALFNRKIAEGLRMRRRRISYPEFAHRPVWIHAASGEFEYAKSVIREIKERWPWLPIVVTYFSPTYAKNAQNFPGVDFALPLPLDLGGPIRSFLNRVNPRVLLISRTDFWPEALTQTRRRQIPIHVFSYTQKNKPGLFNSWRLSLVDQIHCVSDEDLANIQALGSTLLPGPSATRAMIRFDTVSIIQRPSRLI